MDRVLPDFDIRERFSRDVRAPADLVMETAANFDLQSILAIRLIIRLRKFVMRGDPDPIREPIGLLEETRKMGWGTLVDEPNKLVICGAVCQPWNADVTFIPIPAAEFLKYAEPDQVKIVWSLETDELGPKLTRFAHEVRAVATDEDARRKFLRYWRWARFGIVGIRLLLLPAIRRRAERKWAETGSKSPQK